MNYKIGDYLRTSMKNHNDFFSKVVDVSENSIYIQVYDRSTYSFSELVYCINLEFSVAKFEIMDIDDVQFSIIAS